MEGPLVGDPEERCRLPVGTDDRVGAARPDAGVVRDRRVRRDRRGPRVELEHRQLGVLVRPAVERAGGHRRDHDVGGRRRGEVVLDAGRVDRHAGREVAPRQPLRQSPGDERTREQVALLPDRHLGRHSAVAGDLATEDGPGLQLPHRNAVPLHIGDEDGDLLQDVVGRPRVGGVLGNGDGREGRAEGHDDGPHEGETGCGGSGSATHDDEGRDGPPAERQRTGR